jgi:hypothetical protein
MYFYLNLLMLVFLAVRTVINLLYVVVSKMKCEEYCKENDEKNVTVKRATKAKMKKKRK